MKRIFFGSNGRINWHHFFWHPNSFLGYIARILIWIILLFLLLWLLNMFNGCEPTKVAGRNEDPYINDDIRNLPNPHPAFPPEDENRTYPEPPSEDDIEKGDYGQQIISNQLNVIIDPKDGNKDEILNKWAESFTQAYPEDLGYSIKSYNRLTMTLAISLPEEKRLQTQMEINDKIPEIDFITFPEEVMNSWAIESPNDPQFENVDGSWYMNPIQLLDAWEITQGSSDVVIAIVDSYFDLSHEDLSGDRIYKPYCVPRNSANVSPVRASGSSFYHGSMVASQATATVNNSCGLAGVAPKCKFMPVSLGHFVTSLTMAEGILYAIFNGADVINVSMGTDFGEGAFDGIPLEDQIAISDQLGVDGEQLWDYIFKMADERNITIVWAAGNDNILTELDNSKRNDKTIRVAAIDHDLKKADFSNFGYSDSGRLHAITIAAPGVDIFGAQPDNQYGSGPGTSYAAPIVTGTVALMKSVNSNLTNEQVIEILTRTGKPIEEHARIGKLVQIHDAVKASQESASEDNNQNN